VAKDTQAADPGAATVVVVSPALIALPLLSRERFLWLLLLLPLLLLLLLLLLPGTFMS
jgi:hypothetical protein